MWDLPQGSNSHLHQHTNILTLSYWRSTIHAFEKHVRDVMSWNRKWAKVWQSKEIADENSDFRLLLQIWKSWVHPGWLSGMGGAGSSWLELNGPPPHHTLFPAWHWGQTPAALCLHAVTAACPLYGAPWAVFPSPSFLSGGHYCCLLLGFPLKIVHT